MKIVFTGGGTGGHFYPIIAVAEGIQKVATKEHILGLKLYFLSTDKYDAGALFDNDIEFRRISAGKRRAYKSINNFFDIFKTIIGFFEALGTLFIIYPDVVFSKGGYCAFPVVLAARVLGIPVVVHESDAIAGRVNKWSGKFAKKVAVSFDEAASAFPEKKVAVTGQPIRLAIRTKTQQGAYEYLKLDPTTPTILILGGSLGSLPINNVVLDTLPQLVEKYQIIHQCGKDNYEKVKDSASFLLANSEYKNRYKVFPFLNPLAMKMAASASSVIISRAGSALFEFANWGIPSILIPLPSSSGDHQRKNAYNYARHGAAVVIEQPNLSPAILKAEIDRFFTEEGRMEEFRKNALEFSTPDAAERIAQVIVDISLKHEK